MGGQGMIFPLMFLIKARLLGWSATLMLCMYLHLWREMWSFLCVSLTPHRDRVKHHLHCSVEEPSDGVLPIN